MHWSGRRGANGCGLNWPICSRWEGTLLPMAEWTIDCSLPYRVRASDRTYTVPSGSGVDVQIELDTVQREEFDPRVGSGTNIEFVVDRFGWAAYSEVKARVEASGDHEAVTRFLSALNNLIAQVRDLFEIPWMHQVDQDDLFNLTVGMPGGSFQTAVGYARTRGIRTAMEGLTESGEEQLRSRLASYQPVASWRILSLDAADALDRGRYEEAVVLAWSALESGCRSALPRLAEQQEFGSVRMLFATHWPRTRTTAVVVRGSDQSGHHARRVSCQSFASQPNLARERSVPMHWQRRRIADTGFATASSTTALDSVPTRHETL